MNPTSRSDRTRPSLHCLLALVVGAAIAACATPETGPPDADSAHGAAAPAPDGPQPATGTTAGSRAAASLPPATRARYESAATYSAEHSGYTLLIVQGEEVVFEVGHNGHAADEPLPLHSASESFFGLLAAAADADGLLDLDEPAVFSLPEFEADPRKRDIRIRQLLNYTSGIEPGVGPLNHEDVPNLYEWALSLDMLAEPGERFQYGPGQLYVFAAILDRKLDERGLDPVAYLEERILDPIGLTVAAWDRDASGNPDIARGARLSAREWAKLGILLKNRGVWQGREVVPDDAVAAVFEPSRASKEFGLALWLNRAASARTPAAFYPDGLPELALAAGLGNQRLYVIPSLDLVVVRMGERDRRWRDAEFLGRLVE